MIVCFNSPQSGDLNGTQESGAVVVCFNSLKVVIKMPRSMEWSCGYVVTPPHLCRPCAHVF